MWNNEIGSKTPEELRLIDAIESLSDLIDAGATVEADGMTPGQFDPFTFTADEAELVAGVIDDLKMVRESLFGR